MTLLVWSSLLACTGNTGETPAPARQLTLAAYTTPREAYGKAILPGFAAKWAAERGGEQVTFQESYQGSGAQARAVVDGFEADVVALSLEPDVRTVQKAGLITRDWAAGEHHGVVTTSYAVIAVRPGNPKNLHDWADLAQPGLEVLTPNVRTSGGAMWNVAALYGAALRGHVANVPANDPAAAEQFLASVLKNVKVMDKGARESMVTFESGVGDAAITYENEVLVAEQAGKELDYVVPSSTILIENPVAVVDAYAQKHGTTELADAFVAYLTSSEAQAAFAKFGLRSVAGPADPSLPAVSDGFTIRDPGGWDDVASKVFAEGGSYDKALALAQGGK
jgi:sulfate transport system substrate-binding protein